MQIKIEKNVPIPGTNFMYGGKWNILLSRMVFRDSVVLDNQKQVNALRFAAKRKKVKILQWAEDKKIRIWKIKK